jgi:HAE1 family hydrophobic/amphiphilic exporter-1
MRLTQLFVRRPTLAMVFCCLVILAGVLAWRTLVQQQFPNIDFPTVSVRLSYSGAPPSEIRDAIVRPIEDAIAGAPNLDRINANIQQGTANVNATFSLGSDLTTDLVEVQRRVQSVRAALPTDLSPPTIQTFDPSQANVATLTATSSTMSAAALSSLVNDELVPEMEQIDGVASVSAAGSVTPAIEVEVDPNKISAAKLTLGDVVTAISSNNVRAPGGIVYGTDRETTVDVRGDLSNVLSVANLPLGASSGTGQANLTGPSGGSNVQSPLTGAAPGTTANTSVAANASTATTKVASSTSLSGYNGFSIASRQLRISDVARVVDSYEVKRVFSYVNGYPAITLNVQKQTGASEVTASANVLAALPRLRTEYPAVNFAVLNVQSQYTQAQLNSVYLSLSEGIVFTGIVMLFFLRSWRNSIVVLIAIPTSLGVTIFLMSLLNFSIDTISLLAMTLVIGILVDDSIVVLENTERHFESGEAPQTAALLGRTEIGPAAVVITLVDVVVFAPISFLPGTVGRFFSEFGLVVVAATLTSLLVSFTVTPALAGNWSLLSKWKPPFFIDAFTRAFDRTRRFYVEHVLDFALAHRWPVVVVIFLAVGASAALIPLGFIGFDFIPPVDRGEVFVNVNFPIGTPLATADDAIRTLSREYVGDPDVQSITSTSGQYSSGFGGGFTVGSSGQIHLFLQTSGPRRLTTVQWSTMLQKKWSAEYPAAQIVAIGATGTGGGNSQPIDYTITSTDDQPEKYVPAIQQLLQNTPGAIAVNSSLTNAVPQLDVTFDREKARALDTNIATAANAVKASFGGSLAAQFATAFGIKYVQVTYPKSAQSGLDAIRRIPIRTIGGSLITVGDISTITNDPVPPLIQRNNRQTVVHVGANAAPGVALSKVQDAFMKKLPSLNLPAGVSLRPNAGGQQQNLVQTVSGLGTALLLAFVLVYLLMVALYDSYVLPFIIMFAVPVASIGALSSLAITNQPLDLFSLIGTIMLVGLASKNGILIVDFANHRIRAGIDRVTAVRESAKERFRPIVMTTVSMIAGMTPIALALDPGSSVRQALGVVVIGGLLSSLVLTLVLVPIVFIALAPRYDKPRKKKGGPKVPTAPALGGEPIVRQTVSTRLASEGNAS